MTSKAPRQGNVLPRKKLSPEELVSVQICLNNVIRELEAKKANNGGKMPYGAISRTVSAKQCIFPWISVNQGKQLPTYCCIYATRRPNNSPRPTMKKPRRKH